MSPGVTKQLLASITSLASGGVSSEEPTPEMSPLVIATQPPGNSRRVESTVATNSALRTSRSARMTIKC